MTIILDGTKGTTTPGLYSSTTFTGTYTDGIVVDYTTGIGRISVGTADGLAFYNAGVATTELMRLDSSGNLGIGLTPITGTSTGNIQVPAGYQINASNGGIFGNLYYASGWKYAGNGQGGYIKFGSATPASLEFGVAGTNSSGAGASASASVAAIIDSSGNLLVGKTSTGYSSVGIELRPGATASSIFCIANAPSPVMQVTNSPNGYLLAFYRQDTGGLMGYIINGASNTVAYTSSSDYRLKENIQPMQNALAKVQQLNPVTYKWKSDGSEGQGFIAHELQAVVPDCVTGEKDAVDADGNPVYQGIDTSFLVATLTAAIQEQQAIIEQLRADVAQLKGQA